MDRHYWVKFYPNKNSDILAMSDSEAGKEFKKYIIAVLSLSEGVSNRADISILAYKEDHKRYSEMGAKSWENRRNSSQAQAKHEPSLNKIEEEVDRDIELDKISRSRKAPTRPQSDDEVLEYFSKRLSVYKAKVQADKWLNRMEASDWHDSKGKLVKNWKLSANTWITNHIEKGW